VAMVVGESWFADLGLCCLDCGVSALICRGRRSCRMRVRTSMTKESINIESA
jgi:hypothetical protein